ncbi:MAG: hypothetical protein JWL81_825, partial [Verrucomicrobiales bacterium]|nr:hypothetical protein [Verrucomicrobiales bacterium]
GPMGGIVSCLETMKSDRLLVLAVDLPAMRPEVLEKILAAAERDAGCQDEGSPGCAGISQEVGSGTVVMSGAGVESGALGAVFQSGEFLEPLAAVYPKSMLPAGRRRLEEGNRSLKEWIHESAKLMRILPLPEVWSTAFQNVNDPVEWKHWLERGPV